MKKIVYLCVLLSVLMIFGCGKATVEDVAKDYVEKQFRFDTTVKLDMSNLKYKAAPAEGNTVVVKVSGPIYYEGKVTLVKVGREWKVETPEAAQVQPEVSH